MKEREKTTSLPKNVWLLTVASFLNDISSEMILHLIPLFLVNVLGVRTITVGLIEGVAETTASLLKIVSGRVSDQLGRRKWLTVAGYGLSTLAKPFLLLANSWLTVFAVRFGDKFGKGIRTAPRDALLADGVPAEKRGLAFGLHRAGDTAGAALGLLIALLVVWQMQGGQLTLAVPTFRLLVALSVVPAGLAVLLLAFGLRERPAEPKAHSQTPLTALPASFYGLLAIFVLFSLGNSSDAFLILRAQERGLSLLAILGLQLFFNLIYAGLATPAGALSDRLGRKRVLLLGWLVYALVYIGFAFAQQGWHIWLLFALYALYYGLSEGVAKALIADLTRPEQRGTAYGLYHAAIGLTTLPASLLAGLLWQGLGSWPGFGPQGPFAFAAGLALIAAGLLWRHNRYPSTAIL